MSKKNYLVKLELICDVLVIGAETEEKAYEFARDEATLGDAVINGAEIEEVTDDSLESERRHATVISEER